jgi:hypothetical protein
MLRFLKWIFLVFGGIAVLILSFFYIQNRHDLKLFFETKDTLNYELLANTCLEVNHNYYYPCLENNLKKYLTKVSLTGTSLGLKAAFNFIEEDRVNQKLYITEKQSNIRYALNHLRINNLALDNATKRFFGLEFTYGGYVGKIKDFHIEAKEFSDGIIEGLQGEDGIQSVLDPSKQSEFSSELSLILSDYKTVQEALKSWVDAEVKRLKAMHDV